MAQASATSFSWLPGAFGAANAGLEVLKLENIEFKDILFSHSATADEGSNAPVESYKGGWRDGQPEGEGRYTWTDGSTYEGSWSRGQKHGWGQYIWPTGAVYLGEWQNGNLQGYGTFTSLDGSRYQGTWANNLKHGIGTKWHPNGDRYEGLWRYGEPNGPGRYVYCTGNEFDGEWKEGMFHGKGTFKWSTGHRYDGEWRNGAEEGIGVFTWPDSSTYEGFWLGGVKDGVGVFRPKSHRPSSQHHQLNQASAAAAAAAVTNATMTIASATVAASQAALAHLSDSASAAFVGLSSKPAPPQPSPPTIPEEHVLVDEGVEGVGGVPRTTATIAGGVSGAGAPQSPLRDPPLNNTTTTTTASAAASPKLPETITNGPPGSPPGHGTGPRPVDAAIAELAGDGGTIFVCEYRNGQLVLEEAIRPEDLAVVFGLDQGGGGGVNDQGRGQSRVQQLRNFRESDGSGGGGGGGRLIRVRSRVHRRRRRREDRMGETIFKGSRSYDLMLNLQLGIRYTLATLSKQPPPSELLPAHFQEKVWLRFPRQGSEVTPPHPSNDFKWKDYGSTVFRKLRGLFDISNSEYILSTCGDHALRELPSPGKSGSVFFVSQDERFIIKTMRKEEVKLLLRALPAYYAHVAAHPDTLLTRFYGVHRIQPSGVGKVRFVVMNNFFATDLPLHRKFDLKGSTYKRTAGPMPSSSDILKDLDLDSSFQLHGALSDRLLRQLTADAKFLESIQVMDYSLLLGVHLREREWAHHHDTLTTSDEPGGDGDDAGDGGRVVQPLWTQSEDHDDEDDEDDGDLGGSMSQPTSPLTQFSSSNLGATSTFYSSENVDFLPVTATRGATPLTSADAEVELMPAPAPPRIDRDHLITVSTHNMTKNMAAAAQRQSAKLSGSGFLGVHRYMAWRRDLKEKKRQKAEQQNPRLEAPPPPLTSPLPALAAVGDGGGAASSSTVENTVENVKQQQSSAAAGGGGAGGGENQSGVPGQKDQKESRRFRVHRRTVSAMPSLGSLSSIPIGNSPAAANNNNNTSGGDPNVAHGPARTATVTGNTGNSSSSRGKLLLRSTTASTYSQRLAEQHAALVASLDTWNVTSSSSIDAVDATTGTNGSTTTTTTATTTMPLLFSHQPAVLSTAAPPTTPTNGAQSYYYRRTGGGSFDDATNTTTANGGNGPFAVSPQTVVSWRADAALIPEDPFNATIHGSSPSPGAAVTGTRRHVSQKEPTTPPTAKAFETLTHRQDQKMMNRFFFDDGRPASAPSTALASTAAGVGMLHLPSPFLQERLSAVAAEQQQQIENGEEKEEETTEAAAAAGEAAHGSALLPKSDSMNGSLQPTTTTADQIEIDEDGERDYVLNAGESTEDLASILAERLTKTSTTIPTTSDTRLSHDLLRLARHKMLGPSAASGARFPTAVLAARHVRSGSALRDGGVDVAPVAAAAGAGVKRAPLTSSGGGEQTQSLSKQLPAVAVALKEFRRSEADDDDNQQQQQQQQDAILFLGVIDWLQPYNTRKRFEHSFKSILLDGSAISVCEPSSYARRFMKLMRNVFVAAPPTTTTTTSIS